jgi:hypothetical protein
LTLLDWFTPSDQLYDNTNDLDVGSSGPLLIPNSSVLVGGGKDSILYLLNSGNLGHETSNDSTALQKLNANGSVLNGPAFWNGPAGPLVYLWAAGNYQISGPGIATSAVSATDSANTDFSGAFTQANNSAGNYVVFTINATGFTLTATPGAASDGVPRAPVNGIQIIPR